MAHFYTVFHRMCAPRDNDRAQTIEVWALFVTTLRTRTCSSCACGYLGKKEELNTKILSQTAAYN